MDTTDTVLESQAWSAEAPAERLPRTASDLARPLDTVTPSHTNRDVINLFKNQPFLVCLPVVEDGVPIGMINRGIFLTGFSMPFHREIYERKSCIAFMDKTPLVVDGGMPISELGRLAVGAGAKVLQDGFLVTVEGRFHGQGTGLDLLRALGSLERQRHQVIHESIAYAQIIQGALLATSMNELRECGLTDQHLLWKPRDQVGGDAFFARRIKRDGRDGLFLALMDCTGHGVPGAFTAMLMTSFLGHALDLALPWEPGKVLAEANRRVKEELGQRHGTQTFGSLERAEGGSAADEGMDATCLWIDRTGGGIVFSGARHSLWVLHEGRPEPEEIKGDRIGVGYTGTPDDQEWTCRALTFPPATVLFAATDGIVDQIGGPKRIAFGKRRLWEALQRDPADPSLRATLERSFLAMEAYQGAEERRDDICLLAVQL